MSATPALIVSRGIAQLALVWPAAHVKALAAAPGAPSPPSSCSPPPPDGGIAGVYSLSEEKPFKTAGFKLEYAGFEGKEKYSEWQFAYVPVAAVVAPKPAAGPAAK